MKLYTFITGCLVTLAGLSAVTALSAQSAAASGLTTTFGCIQSGSGYATIAKRGDRATPPMIKWTKTVGNLSPLQRCEIVSKKLSDAVASNGGKFKNLNLTYGRVNSQMVICHVSSKRGACNPQNVLLTLPKANDAQAKQDLETLVNFGVQGSGSALQQSGPRYYAPIGEAMEKFLGEETTTPSPTTKPAVTPQANNNLEI